jgi:integrase
MAKGTGSVVKLVTYQLDGKNVSKKTPGAVRVESANWFILYYGRDGEQRREATGTANLKEAEAMLARRVVHTEDGETPVADLKSLRYEDLRDAYLRAKPEQAECSALKHLDGFFAGMRVHDKKRVAVKIQDFIEHRREEDEAADPTIRRNLVCLRAMFNHARKSGTIGANDVPYFPMPEDSAPAGQYIPPADFAGVLAALPENLRPFFQFMYATGCRLGALRKIRWSMVSKDGTQINLPGEIVKSGKPLLIVLAGFYLKPIADKLKTRFRNEDSPVFDSTNYRFEWSKAIAKVGLGTWDKKTRDRTGVRIHDCRCSAAINALAAGVDESTVLKIGGWKTRAMLDRYNVQHADILKAAMEKAAKYVSAAEQQAAAQ